VLNHIGSYDLETVHSIVNTTPVLHVSFQPDPSDPFPAILPMIGQMGSYARPSSSISDPLDCYLHGYVSSRVMNVSRAAIASGKPGLPVCIAATKVDGLVLSLTPNSHSYNYRSAVLFGHAIPVTEFEEKEWAMEMITNSVVPQRYENTRIPPIPAEMQSTQILRVKIDSASSKTRDWIPSDSAEDMANDEIRDKVWTGVVPVYEAFGEPVPSPNNRVEKVPEYVEEYIRESNAEGLAYATEAGEKPVPVKAKTKHDE
jgi:nitroimidazol reductase NimA-like FMN-containing flavoprotein (pyridoxamine 5'-phosphate oxidase superfamily)